MFVLSPSTNLAHEHAPNFKMPWLIQFADAEIIEVETEEKACAIQRVWRQMTGCEPGS